MRIPTSLRLLVPAAALLAAACNDVPSPQEPRPAAHAAAAREVVPVRQDAGAQLGSLTHWADGYLTALTLEGDGDLSGASFAFNRSGRGTITVTKPAGTTGRYVATFGGLSALLGGRSTVHVTGYGHALAGGVEDIACKPTAAYLVSDRVEVRCFRTGSGLPINANFTLLTTRNYADLAFAYAHLSTSTGYSPSSQGSWNPAGTTNVVRSGVGRYRVTFNGLGGQLPPGVAGHVQVNAVGTSNAYCNAYGLSANGTPNLGVDVRCFAAATGAPVDRRFTVLFVRPAEHLAYAWADQPTTAAYAPQAAYSSNPSSLEPISIARVVVGYYTVTWTGLDRHLLGDGNVQVTAYGSNAHCKVRVPSQDGATVQCFAPNGTPVDSRFTVLRGS